MRDLSRLGFVRLEDGTNWRKVIHTELDALGHVTHCGDQSVYLGYTRADSVR